MRFLAAIILSLTVWGAGTAQAATAAGGDITTNGNFIIHTFTNNGTFTVDDGTLICDILIVAGGGGGGGNFGGGGGGGGVILMTNAASNTNAVTIGAGGAGSTSFDTPSYSGGNSAFGTNTAIGGGRGGVWFEYGPGNGGSGGGGRSDGAGGETPWPCGTGTVNQGHDGGLGYGSYTMGKYTGGGGGGASGVGGAGDNVPVSARGGNGGAGYVSDISGTSTTYGSGGGGGSGGDGGNGNIAYGVGGTGAGDGGCLNTDTTIQRYPSSAAGYGCGGGGGGWNASTPSTVYGGAGYQGIVIVRYLSTNAPLTIQEVSPSGMLSCSVADILVRFGAEVNTNTFTLNDLDLTGPGGSISLTGLVAESSFNFRVWPQSILTNEGQYSLVIGPAISNIYDRSMDAAYTNFFSIDVTSPSAPVVTNFSVPPATNFSTSTNITLQGTRDTNTEVWINGSLAIASGSSPWASGVSLTQDLNQISLFAKDLAGNISATNSLLFFADSIPPSVSAVRPVNGAFTNAASVIELACSETGSGLNLAGCTLAVLRAGASIPGSWTNSSANILTFTPSGSFLDGSYSISATLKDNVALTSSPFASSFTLDSVPPAAPTVFPVASPTTISTQLVSGTKESNTAILTNSTVVVSSSATTNWSYGVALTAGSNLFSFVARDAAMNLSPATNVVIVYDNIKPGPVTCLVANVQGCGTNLTLDWTAYDENANGADIGFYTVYQSTSSFTNASQASSIAVRNAGTKTCLVTGLTRNETNYYAVVATDLTGLSDSNVTSIAAAPLDTNAPANPSALAFQCFDDHLTVSWTASPNPDADLAGYRIYVTNETTGAEVAAPLTSYTRNDLSFASAYQFRVTAFDNDNNESAGVTAVGYTLMANPANVTAEPFSGMATLAWTASEPSANVGSYAVYCSEEDFTTVSGMTARATTTSVSASVAGLRDNITNYFAVTAVNKSGGETKSVVAVTAVTRPDTNGPALSNLKWNNAAVPSEVVSNGAFSVSAADPSGVSRVDMSVNGALLGSQAGAGPSFSAYWNVYATTNDGAHLLRIVAWDTLGNSNVVETNITVTLALPPAPVISSPTGGKTVNSPVMPVTGTADRYASSVSFFINDSPTGAAASIASAGGFSSSITLASGTNLIQAAATNRAGLGAKSAAVSVVLDYSIPAAPNNVQAEAREGGVIAVSWWAPSGVNVKGYNLYRSTNSFDTTNQALKVNSSLIAGLGYNDVLLADGTNYYRVETVNLADTPSLPSALVSAYADSTPPHASIAVSTTGMSIPSENRYAQGAVTLSVTVTEPLLTTPFLSVVPNLGTPIIVALSKVTATNYTGSFVISANTPSGTAYLNFSARDKTGNRGTVIDTNATLIVDNAAPVCSQFQVAPSSPILNDAANPAGVTATLIFETNDVPAAAPELFYSLSLTDAGQTSSVPLSQLTSLSWAGTLTLPTNAGVTPETMTFTYRAYDALSNSALLVPQSLGDGGYQIYQGTNPPALSVPSGLIALAKPAGAIDLAWNTVTNASGYQIWRQSPDLTNLAFLGSVTDSSFNDVAPDGTNLYAVASIREANGQQSVSELCAPVAAVADSNAPNAPEALALLIAANGMYVTWTAPAGDEQLKYKLFRATYDITPGNIGGITALITNIPATNVVDTSPLQGAAYYAVVAADAAGNESAPSASVYTNISLLPVSSLSVVRGASSAVALAWTHSNPSGLDGFNVYAGLAGQEIKLNSELLPNSNFEFQDSGFNGGERRYLVKAVDMVGTSAVESVGRSVILPELSVSLLAGSQIKRGVMNRLNFGVANAGATAVTSAVLKAAFAGHEAVSAPFNLAANASNTISVVAGGYAGLPDALVITNTVEITAASGEEAAVIGVSSLTVGTDLLTAEILNDEFTRGATGKARFTLHNTCSEEIEIVMARASGALASGEVRFKLLHPDGSVYADTSVKQSTGAQLYTLSDGVTVARIAPGAEFTCSEVVMNVPSNAPDSVTLKLEVDNVHYRYSYADHVAITGFTGSRAVSIANTPYYAAVTNVSPASSLVATNFVITGHAVNRSTTNVAARVAVRLTVSVSGFDRVYNLFTDESGNFFYTFTPAFNETGIYTAGAVHPDLLDKPAQAQFALTRVIVSPATFTAHIPHNYQQPLTVRVTPSAGLTLTNLFLSLQNPGTMPDGLHIITNAPTAIAPASQTANLAFTLWADNTVTNPGAFTFNVVSDDPEGSGGASLPRLWSSVLVNYTFSAANPVLAWTPSYIETGVAVSNFVTETITLKNTGLADMEQVHLSLITTNGSPAPAWVILNSASNLTALARDASYAVAVTFAPTNGVASANYHFQLRVTGANIATNDINLYVTVDDSAKGEALFTVIDLYYGYQGNTGVNGAIVKLTKQEGTAFTTNMVADSLGETWFHDLPVGRYKFQVTADKHDSYTGTIWIKPGVTANEQVFLQYDLVTVEWSVEPIAIEDCYNIVLTATFETFVPAPVVVPTPMSVSLPDMAAGDVFNGEFILKNYGNIQAENLRFILPAADEYFRIEIQGNVTNQTILLAQGQINVPYRVTCLSDLDAQGGGGCYTWWKYLRMTYDYVASCGATNNAEISFYFSRVYGSCPGGGGSGGGGYVPSPSGGGGEVVEPSGGGSGGGGSGTIPNKPSPPSEPIAGDQACFTCPPCPPGIIGDCGEETCGEPNRYEKIDNSSIDLINRQFHENLDDLSVKVMGGYVNFTREYYSNTWVLARAWQGLEFVYGFTNDVQTVYHGGIKYQAANPEATVFSYDDYHTIYKTDSAYQMQGKNGLWREFDLNGRLLKSGDRSGTLMIMHYDETNGVLDGVCDRFTNQVVWIERNTNGIVTAAADTASGGRRVEYQYDSAGRLTNFVNALSLSTVYEYDASGRITGIRRADGRLTQITYNQYGHVSGVSRTNGYSRTFEYRYDAYKNEYYSLMRTGGGKVTEKRFDANGKMIWSALNGRNTYDANVTDPDAPVNEYDSNGNITKITYPDGSTVTREYNGPNGEMSKEVNEAGIATLYAHDAQGNLTNKVEASGTSCSRETRYAYDNAGNMLSSTIVNPSGTNALTSMSYNDRGKVLTVTDPVGHVTSNSYDSAGNLVGSTDPLGRTRSIIYDSAGKVITATDPAGNITSNSYDLAGNLVRRDVLTADLLTSDFYQYDQENRVIATSNNLGHVTTSEYDVDGNLIQTTDAAGRTTVNSYNADGKITCQSSPAGDIVYVYDEYVRLTGVTDVRGNVTAIEYDGDTERVKTINYPTYTREYSYNGRGRVTEIENIMSDGSRITSYTLDALSQVVSITDPLGRTTHSEYDQLGRRLAVVNALGATNGFEYNIFGNLTKLTDANGNQTAFECDLNGRLTKKIYADNSSWNYEYNAVGNLVKRTDARDQVTAYSYDLLDRLMTNSYYPSSSSYPSSPSKTVSFSHDSLNRMTGWNDGQYSGSSSYDDTNRTRTATVNYGSFSKSFTYHYDLAGKKTSFTGPDGIEITYSYNAENRLSSINIPNEGSIAYSVNQYGQLSGQTLPGGNVRYYGYDAMMSLVTNVALDSAQNPLMVRAYSRNLAGNISGQQTENGAISYNYDAIDQLVAATNSALGNEFYQYDLMGNRQASSNACVGADPRSAIYSINNLNQYSEISNTESQITLRYDLNGNLTNQASATGTNEYAWDIENRLVGFQKQEGTNLTLAQYTYDPFGRRLSKAVNGVTNYYCYSDEGLIGEYDSQGNELCSYGYAPGSLWMNNPVFMHTVIPSLNDGATNYLYYLNDHLGAPQQLVRKNGAIAWAAVMDAFGFAHILPGAVVTNNMRFSSQYYDFESELYYNTHRYYDPVSGRYLSKDPLERRINPGLYAGLLNDPLKYIDADGRDDLYWPPGNNAYSGGVISPNVNRPISDIDVYTGGTHREPGINASSVSAVSPDPNPQAPDPNFFIAPDGSVGFRWYGNWGGPWWTGGQRMIQLEQMTPAEQRVLSPPIDAQDECYMLHDMCYGDCRQENKCNRSEQELCFNGCDWSLSWCLIAHQDRNSWYSLRRYIAAYYFYGIQPSVRIIVNPFTQLVK